MGDLNARSAVQMVLNQIPLVGGVLSALLPQDLFQDQGAIWRAWQAAQSKNFQTYSRVSPGARRARELRAMRLRMRRSN